MKTVKCMAQLLASVTILLVTVSAPAALAQTLEEAVEAIERGDYATALAGFQSYAEQGDADAQFMLGNMYVFGEGVPEDDVAAMQWYRMGAEQGNTDAQFMLGFMYVFGEGVPEDHAARCSGIAWPPSRATPTHSGISISCTPEARASPWMQ